MLFALGRRTIFASSDCQAIFSRCVCQAIDIFRDSGGVGLPADRAAVELGRSFWRGSGTLLRSRRRQPVLRGSFHGPTVIAHPPAREKRGGYRPVAGPSPPRSERVGGLRRYGVAFAAAMLETNRPMGASLRVGTRWFSGKVHHAPKFDPCRSSFSSSSICGSAASRGNGGCGPVCRCFTTYCRWSGAIRRYTSGDWDAPRDGVRGCSSHESQRERAAHCEYREPACVSDGVR
jgi:hypothetical protein